MNKLLLGTLAVILAAAAEPIAVSYLLEDGDLDAAGVLEDATVISLPVLYVILNAVLFGLPMLKTCYAYISLSLSRHQLRQSCPPQHAQRAQVYSV